MNLKFHLLLQIFIAAAICLLATTVYVLYQANQQTKQETEKTAESLVKQLQLQLLRIDIGFELPGRFPDLALWKQTHNASGVCVRFNSADSENTQSICHGTAVPEKHWPSGFEKIYRLIFNPGFELLRQISFRGRIYGSISVAPSIDRQLARAWTSILALMKLSVITVLAVCLLVFAVISRSFRPAQVIVTGLERLRNGDLTARLPSFEIIEWQRTSIAINELAASQQQLQSERKKLTLKLMTLQEDERSNLARDLHDELGQCLAAINAVAASIAQTAKLECPTLVPEIDNISRINRHIMDTVRALLVRLRPAEIDELGLESCLNSLIIEWNSRSGDKIQFRLQIHGDCRHVPKPLAISLYRIVQECLTNVAKHSSATDVSVTLNIAAASIALTIEDNGCVKKLPFVDNPGIGLLGIRERVSALDGQLLFAIGKPGGLVVQVKLPMQANSGMRV